MDQLSMLWLVGVVALLIGAVIGLLLARSSAGARSREALIEELNDTRRELDTYREQVTQHFAETARLINRLTESYRDVHQHLSASAQQLCVDKDLVDNLLAEQARPLLETAKGQSEDEAEELPVEPPRDYAPRRAPDEEGMLSEQFGLKKAAREESVSIDPSRAADATASVEAESQADKKQAS